MFTVNSDAIYFHRFIYCEIDHSIFVRYRVDITLFTVPIFVIKVSYHPVPLL